MFRRRSRHRTRWLIGLAGLLAACVAILAVTAGGATGLGLGTTEYEPPPDGEYQPPPNGEYELPPNGEYQLPPPPPGQPPARPGDRVTIRIVGRRLVMNRRGVIRARLRCPPWVAASPCAGRLVLRTARRVPFRGQRRRVRLGRTQFRVRAGQTRRVRIRVNRRKARLLRRDRRARRVQAVANVRDQAGNRARVSKRMRVRVRGGRR